MAVLSKMNSLVKLAVSLALLAGSVIATDASPENLEKRQGGTFAITGASGSTQPRLEIRTLAGNADAWNLYLLALNDFKWQPQNGLTSYYQIAGVHGVPNIPWDGATGNPNQGVGYCTHVSPLFPGWHRAYVVLYEQAFLQSVQRVVNQFQGADRTRYQAAAANFRIPYWDWAAVPAGGQPVMPPQITNRYATVNTPSGTQTWLNPLFRFDTHPLDHNGFLADPWDNWPVTLRYPNSTDPAAVVSQNNLAINSLNSDNPSLRSRIYSLFTSCSDLRGFGNSASSARTQQCQDSLESIHNNIHNDVGGPNGHMTILWYAAFDPSFWLHHANVDRLFALWQGLYPNSYSMGAQAGQGTYAMASGTYVDANTGLSPFHRDTAGNFLTTNGVRSITNFRYTYPELSSGDTSPAGIRSKVNALYGNGARASRRDLPKYPMQRRDGSYNPLVPSGVKLSPSSGPKLPNLPSNDSALLSPNGPAHYDYNCNIQCEGFALGSSYNVYIFLDSPTTNQPTAWAFDQNLVGTHSNFAAPGMHSRTLVSGNVVLTNKLVEKLAAGVIPSLDRDVVLPYLKKNLQWHVMKSDGSAVPNDQVPGLTVAVRSTKVSPAKSDSDFPSYGHWEDHHDVTHGKPGGIQQGMESDWYNYCGPA